MPAGSRATQLWTYRSSSFFIDTFGRPDPNQDPPCERTSESTAPQILHLMNSPALNHKLVLDSARPAKLAAGSESNEKIVEEAYLLVYSRLPMDDEKRIALEFLTKADVTKGDGRRRAVEDLFWALINTPEFLFLD